MKHYNAILVEYEMGEWRAILPDIPGCEARGFSLDDAKFAAATVLRRYVEENASAPQPMDLSMIEHNEEWLRQNHVDLSKAVVSMIPLDA